MIRASLLGLSLLGMVDRVEGDFAIVEWSTGEWSDVPRALWPAPLHEGEALTLQLRLLGWRGVRGRLSMESELETPYGNLALPPSALQPDRWYRLTIRTEKCRTPAPSPRGRATVASSAPRPSRSQHLDTRFPAEAAGN